MAAVPPGETKKRILVGLLSGGLDSAVAFAMERTEHKYDESIAVFLSWGQTALTKEVISFGRVCDFLSVDVTHRHVYKLGFEWCVPAEPESGRLFPIARNLVFLAVVCAAAGTLFPGQNVIVTIGFTANDGYADTSDEFLERVRDLVQVTSKDSDRPPDIHIKAPLRKQTKADCIRWALYNHHEALLELTWSCYRGGAVPCGTCPACKLRTEAFATAEVPDPAAS